MRTEDERFESLLRSYALRLDREIAVEDAAWGGRVPERLDRRIEALTLGAGAAGAAALAGTGLRKTTTVGRFGARLGRLGLLGAIKGLVAALAAAALLLGGAYLVSPVVRETVENAVSGLRTAPEPSTALPDSPADWVIPSPGADFKLRDEAGSGTMQGRWFTNEARECMVQIAARLPGGSSLGDGAEPVEIGGLPGEYQDTGLTQVLLLRAGDTLIRIEFWGAERGEVIEYAERLIESNE